MSNRNGIEIGAVPAKDDTIVAVNQEGRTCVAGGQENRPLDIHPGQIITVDLPHPENLPGRQAFFHLQPCQFKRKTGGQFHFAAPGFVSPPAGLCQKVGCRGKYIRETVPDITFAVVIGIHSKTNEGGGHELGLSHGAGPGADHVVYGNMPFVNNCQGCQEFSPEEVVSSRIVSQCRQ